MVTKCSNCLNLSSLEPLYSFLPSTLPMPGYHPWCCHTSSKFYVAGFGLTTAAFQTSNVYHTVLKGVRCYEYPKNPLYQDRGVLFIDKYAGFVVSHICCTSHDQM